MFMWGRSGADMRRSSPFMEAPGEDPTVAECRRGMLLSRYCGYVRDSAASCRGKRMGTGAQGHRGTGAQVISLFVCTGPPVPVTARMHTAPLCTEKVSGVFLFESTLAVIGTGGPKKTKLSDMAPLPSPCTLSTPTPPQISRQQRVARPRPPAAQSRDRIINITRDYTHSGHQSQKKRENMPIAGTNHRRRERIYP
eukprot:9503968-Pyramimonas_sp.AAC.2